MKATYRALSSPFLPHHIQLAGTSRVVGLIHLWPFPSLTPQLTTNSYCIHYFIKHPNVQLKDKALAFLPLYSLCLPLGLY